MQRLLFAHAEGCEHLFLQVTLEDPYRSSSDFIPIEDHIVCVRFDLRIRMCQVLCGIRDGRVVVDHHRDVVGFR